MGLLFFPQKTMNCHLVYSSGFPPKGSTWPYLLFHNENYISPWLFISVEFWQGHLKHRKYSVNTNVICLFGVYFLSSLCFGPSYFDSSLVSFKGLQRRSNNVKQKHSCEAGPRFRPEAIGFIRNLLAAIASVAQLARHIGSVACRFH